MLTYLEFLLFFLVVPILALVFTSLYRSQSCWWDRNGFYGLTLMIVLSVVYTTPWDNLLIQQGVWWYGEDVTMFHIWEAPIGEYMFFVLQPILTGLFLFQISKVKQMSLDISNKKRLQGVVASLLVTAFGAVALLTQETFYLGSILFWAGSILMVQWGFGWPYLLKNFKVLFFGVTIPTVYLWMADAYAISRGLWTISDEHTVGIGAGSLPLEEALFFLVTNIFVVQGMMLYRWVAEEKTVRQYIRSITTHKV